MKLIDWLTKRDPEGFFDYSTILMRVEQLERAMSDACLHKQFDKVSPMADELIEQAILLKRWIKAQK